METVSYFSLMGIPVEYDYDAFCNETDDTAKMMLSWMITGRVSERASEAEELYSLISDRVHEEARKIQEATRGHICDGEIGTALIRVLTKLVKEDSDEV